MAWIRQVSPADAGPELRELYERHFGKSANEADNILQVGGLHPSGLDSHLSLYKVLMFGRSLLTRVQREMIATVVSSENGCHY